MSTTNQIADALEKSGIPFVRVAGVADGIEYWGLTVIHENIHAEVRECADWVEMKVWHYTPEQFMNMLTGVGTCQFNVVIDNDPSPRHRGNICECNKCGYRCARGFIVDEHFKCCPNCGRRITKEVTE